MTSASGAGAHTDEDRFSIKQVLECEMRWLQKAGFEKDAEDLKSVFEEIHELNSSDAPSAICLSGGGIRSATFNLGVIQAFARAGLLERFDYLSSVSGGGYIAGWLKAWAQRCPMPGLVEQLTQAAQQTGFNPLAPEPKPLDHLREYSNYLTPHLGLFSADTWAAVATVLRNLILNWLVLIPVLTAVAALPQIALIVAASPVTSSCWLWALLGMSVFLGLCSSVAIHSFRYHAKTNRASSKSIFCCGVMPLFLACLLLSFCAPWFDLSNAGGALWTFCFVWCLLIPAAGWAVAVALHRQEVRALSMYREFRGILVSGAAAAGLLYGVAIALMPVLKGLPPVYTVFATPILLLLYLLARALFVAFAADAGETKTGRADHANADREWWARASGYVLVLALSWAAVSALVILGGFYLRLFVSYAWVAASGGTASGLATALLGASSKTSAGKDRSATAQSSPVRELTLSLLAPLTVALVLLALAELSTWLAMQILNSGWLVNGAGSIDLEIDSLRWQLPTTGGISLQIVVLALFLAPLGLALLSLVMSTVVNVNRYSLHGLYRNRLVRAYLGASNTSRKPDPFTGFDPADDLRLHQLASQQFANEGQELRQKPFPVINVALNLVRGDGKHLAWQQRKAESFSMTPLYCGNFHEGYRRSTQYGGPGGVTLGTAIAISGAAASPNSGYHSSPVVTFLMGLFNLRLGSWLGNTNVHGDKVYRLSAPRLAWRALFSDLFGLTDAVHPYINLSDGGHFENLGAYEMVLRRCRSIVVCDADCDPAHDFEDLGNLIRKVRIDFGIPIEFDRKINILPRQPEGQFGLACAVATVRYDLVDGRDAPKGRLLYIKPTLQARGPALPYDVTSYSRGSLSFPHESTADQWFSESQFESYRALGEHLVGHLCQKNPSLSVADFIEAVRLTSS